MVSASEGLIYYCTVFLTALVFLTEASAITTNYEKSNSQTNKTTYEAQTLPPQQRTKSTPTRNRTNLSSKHQNHDRVHPVSLTKLKSNAKIEVGPRTTLQNDEILLSSNSGGDKEIKDKGGGGAEGGGGGGVGSNVDDDDQKTLLQQVMDGKYGLIQDEIFAVKPKRLGVISYDANPEVPKDNINNLGGLDSEDIWLAENHLLVLAGSRLNAGNQWMPIDDYIAPSRPVKIPPKPKVPPPFPVQLTENGPVEYIGSSPKRPEPSVGIFNPLHLQYANFNASPNVISMLYGKLPYGSAGNPLSNRLSMKLNFPSNANLPPLQPPVNIKPPIGAEFIPPYLGVTNQSEIDEDDPSLYYPPPYDFYYSIDNTTRVPAGPLVPGIVMPPPPNFFSTFENNSANTKSEYPIQQTLIRNKPHKENTYKIGKQLHHANRTAVLPSPNESPSWHPNNLVIYNEIMNDQKYPTNTPKVKDDEVNHQVDWIPIPAPTPLYITGPKKPNKNTVLVMTDSLKSPGYSYNQPKSALSLPGKKQPAKLLQQTNGQVDFPSTTPFIYPQLVSTALPSLQSTTPIPPYKQSPTIKATYYFYDEPKFENYNEPKPLFTNAESPPIAPYHEQLPKLQSVGTTANKERNKFNEKKRPPSAPFIPIYYLAELDNIVDFVKPVTPPEPEHVPKSEYYTTTAKPIYTINKPHYDQPTPKPIFEYSYVASNYNNPGLSSIADSTLGPIQPSNFNTAPPVSNYPFQFNDFYGPPPHQQQQQQQQQHHQQQQQQQQEQKRPPIKFPSLQSYSIFPMPVQTTATPILLVNHIKQYAPTNIPHYNFERPWVQDLNLFSKYSYATYPTENPYYAFFTKEDADLIDENTKKYFTIFGQKIKHGGVESTSPLPVIQTIAAPETGDSRYHTKYRMYKKYPSQPSQNAYSIYSTTAVPYETPTSTDESEDINKPLYHSGDYNLARGVTYRPHAEHTPSKLAKHIRPIVVQDLPADLNERLKNIIYVRHQDRPNNTPHSQFRYKSTDNIAYDNQPYRYPEYFLNKYQNVHREPAYSEHEPSSTAISLHDDVRVNYRRAQKLAQDPDAEYIRNSSENVGTLDKGTGEDSYEEAGELSTPKLISLENDVLVNYRKLHPTNPDAEYIDMRHQTRPSSRVPTYSGRNEESSSTYISSKVEHDRFYFFTSPKTHLAEIEDERYDSQSNVEKPSTYIKRVIEKPNEHTSRTGETA